MAKELSPGSPVRMKSGSEGWVRGVIVEFTDVSPTPSSRGMTYAYTGPGYKVKVLEGKHKGETIRLPANYVEPIAESRPSGKSREKVEMTKGRRGR